MAHLPCIHYSKAQIDTILEQFRENGIENILALRGDRVEGLEPTTDFDHAADLIRYIRSKTAALTLPAPAIRSATRRRPTWIRTSAI